MNSVLQCVLQVPWIKAYFLRGGHMREGCPAHHTADAPSSDASFAPSCLGCQLDSLYTIM